MVQINWTAQSLDDIANIAEFIAKDSQKYAVIQVDRFFDSVKILNKQPVLGKPVPEINDKNIREILQGSYRIIYRLVSEDKIDILTIHHSRRLLSNNPIFRESK